MKKEKDLYEIIARRTKTDRNFVKTNCLSLLYSPEVKTVWEILRAIRFAKVFSIYKETTI